MTLLGDTRTLFYTYIALRVVLLLVYLPEVLTTTGIERGLTTLGDFREHYALSQCEQSTACTPYRDYWVEFPPIWIILTRLAAQVAPNFTIWATMLYGVMLLFDAGNLLLVRRLGALLHGEEIGIGLGWVYAVMAAPLVMLAWNFEVIVAFSLLAGFYGYAPTLRSSLRISPQGIAIGAIALGILTKYIPVLFLPTVWKYAPRRMALIYTLTIAAIVTAILIPLIAWGGEMAIQSLTIQFSKPAYQTVWALAEGNYGTGSFPAGAVRYDADWEWPSQPALGLTLFRSALFGVVGLWLFWRSTPNDLMHQFAFFTLTLTLFMLWSQGWSPQWAVVLIPCWLLMFPHRAGVLLCLALTVGAFLEYPTLFRQTADTGHVIVGQNRLWFAALILTRTALLTGVSVALIRQLHSPKPIPQKAG